MDQHKSILEIMGKLLGKKDARTISKLGENHPHLYRLIRELGPDRMDFFFRNGNFGVLQNFLRMDEDELIGLLDKQAHIHQGDLDFKRYVVEMERHISDMLHIKLEKFYKSKAGGYGLKHILEVSLSAPGAESVSDTLGSKETVLHLISIYQTSLSKFEAPSHKRILMDFIEENITSYEAEILLAKKGKLT